MDEYWGRDAKVWIARVRLNIVGRNGRYAWIDIWIGTDSPIQRTKVRIAYHVHASGTVLAVSALADLSLTLFIAQSGAVHPTLTSTNLYACSVHTGWIRYQAIPAPKKIVEK